MAIKTRAVYQAITQVNTWLNTSRSLTSDDLTGRIILLDFWTFCCINCMHVIPDLQALEKQFGNALTVIGVHSAKFENERETENIRSAIRRYEIEHPVVNDSQFLVWRTFAVRAWPTQVLINPAGEIEQVYSGEGHREDLRRDISRLLAEFAGQINTSELPLQLERTKAPATPLMFPGKLSHAEDLGLLFISDSNHNRIVGVKLTGEIEIVVGGFRRPQGVLYRDNVLYVADTENHAIRKIDLVKKDVTTLAGTGKQGNERAPQNAPALETPLSSPWDLAFYPSQNEIAIAMAGTHQLWTYHLAKKTVSVLAGNGRESIDDGPYPSNSLSQPSGLSATGDKLYFVDSETSSLRVLEKGQIRTLIGTGLFDFGFKDGPRDAALMQHSIGLYADSWSVYVADTYNHAIRRYDIRREELETICGGGGSGFRDGTFPEAKFYEPNGLLKINQRLYVADTNNHQIRVVDLTKGEVTTLRILE